MSHSATAFSRNLAMYAVLCLILLFTGAQTAPAQPAPVKNVIFMIGDGMGIAQIDAGRFSSVGMTGRLNLESFPVVGLLKTHPADELITDSAAGGTALATGVKTKNGMIAMTPDGKPARSLLELARAKGMATGLVVTSTITHATPAVFAAHIHSRRLEANIAVQMLAAKINVLLGGGKSFFVPKSAPGSKREDGRDLLAEARQAGYEVALSKSELAAAKSDRLIGLFSDGGMTTKDPEPSLAEMTQKAIDALSRNEKGFFLMVEGSQIDWRSHANDAAGEMRQMLLFDAAIKVALDFAREDGKTLIVVTADHETGGMTITGGKLDGSDLQINWATTHHSAVDVPIFAFGPNAVDFTGIYENTEVPKKIARFLGFAPFPQVVE